MGREEPLSGPDAAARRFAVRQILFALVFAALMIGATFVLQRVQSPVWRWVIVAVPAAALIAWAWHIYSAVRHADEMVRAMLLQAFAIAGLIVLTVATAWGLFEFMLNAPEFPAFLLLPAFSVVFGAVMATLKVRA